MDIAKNNVEYGKYRDVWERCNDAVAGQDAIKAKGKKYLPMLPGMQLTSDGGKLYELYLENAMWYPGTGRTMRAYVGTMFRKPAAKQLPPAMESVDDIFTSEGQTLDGFARELAENVIDGYRPGILIDYPDVDTDGMSLAEAEAIGARPYASLYPAENIVNWSQAVVGGNLKTVAVLLEERMIYDEAIDRTNNKLVIEDGYATFRRLIELVMDDGMYYRQSLYALTENEKTEKEYKLVSSKIPYINGSPLNFIPFIPVTTSGLIWSLDYPMINDIANLNIADYRNEALYRDALLFNGRPTPCVSGLIMDNGQKYISLGSSTVLQFEQGGSWGTLGGGADAVGLKESGEELKRKMALVGSRALAEDPRGVEAADTAALHRQGEDGILSSVADAVSSGMTKALEIIRDWWPTEGEVEYTLSNDFIPGDVDPARMQAVWAMYTSGDISFNTFFSYLQRGEVYPEGWTQEEEMTAIESSTLDIGADAINADIPEASAPTG